MLSCLKDEDQMKYEMKRKKCRVCLFIFLLLETVWCEKDVERKREKHFWAYILLYSFRGNSLLEFSHWFRGNFLLEFSHRLLWMGRKDCTATLPRQEWTCHFIITKTSLLFPCWKLQKYFLYILLIYYFSMIVYIFILYN